MSTTDDGQLPDPPPVVVVCPSGLATLVFLLPMLLVFGLFSWWPIVRSFVMSVQQTNLVTAPEFVGLDNFRAVLADPLLGTAVQNTLWFALLALVFGYPVPLVAAVLMSDVRRGRGLFALLAYLPVVIPPAVAVLLWKIFYDAEDTGVFNTVLGWVGLGPVPWLESASTAMPALVLEATWAAAGGTVIIYLAALVSVPPELYDAAEVDGAGIWRKVWHVTVPHLRGIMLITLILQIIGTVQVFLEPYLFTDGGPDNATLTVLLLVYKYAFQNTTGGDYGKATALSLMLAVALAVLSLIYFRATAEVGGVTALTQPTTPPQAALPDLAQPAVPAPSAGGVRRGRARDDESRGITSAYERGHPVLGTLRRLLHAGTARLPRRGGTRTDPVAGQVRDHADPGHPAHADGAVAERRRLGEPAHRVGRPRPRALLLEHRHHRLRLVGDPDGRGGDRRLRAGDPAAAGSGGCSTAWC